MKIVLILVILSSFILSLYSKENNQCGQFCGYCDAGDCSGGVCNNAMWSCVSQSNPSPCGCQPSNEYLKILQEKYNCTSQLNMLINGDVICL